jgi:hypothetical protein
MIIVHEIDRCVLILREFRDGDRGTLICIHNAHRVERVPVHPHDVLFVQWDGATEMEESIHTARHFDNLAKLPITQHVCRRQASL